MDGSKIAAREVLKFTTTNRNAVITKKRSTVTPRRPPIRTAATSAKRSIALLSRRFTLLDTLRIHIRLINILRSRITALAAPTQVPPRGRTKSKPLVIFDYVPKSSPGNEKFKPNEVLPDPPSHREMQNLFDRKAAGDEWARLELIDRNRLLACKCASAAWSKIREFSNSAAFDREDLIQDAYVGLTSAVDSFDHAGGNRFSTYARERISGEIWNNYREIGHLIKIPRSATDKFKDLKAELKKLELTFGKTVSVKDLSAKTGWTIEKCQEYLSNVELVDIRYCSLKEIEHLCWQDKGSLRKERIEWIERELLRCLEEREKDVILLRYGLCGDGECLSFQQIAEKLKVSAQTVGRLERTAILKMRSSLFMRHTG